MKLRHTTTRLNPGGIFPGRGLAWSAGLRHGAKLRGITNSPCRRPALRLSPKCSERASVLIIVLWVCLGLVSIALYFANSMTYELRASDNRVSGLVSDQAIEGAARYVGYVLQNFATNGAVPATNQFAREAVPIGDAKFWLIGRDATGQNTTEPAFGLIDEGSKLNLNTANTNTLSYLPNMTTDFAQAIMDWRGTNGVVSLDYATLGYLPKNAPFETVDELRLVYGADISLLAGDDINRNGVLDANEKDSTGTGQLNSGLFEYTTVWTREPNFHSDGSSLTNVNTASPQTIQALLQADGVSSATTMAQSIWRYVHNTPGRVNNFNNILDLALQCQRLGMSEADFAKIYNDVTTSTNTYFRGRINVNTASADVLTALFMGLNNNISQETASGAAQTLITYREQNAGNLNSIWWLIDALGSNNQVITALAGSTVNSGSGYVTTKSFQFTADIAAVGPFGRGYRRVKFIFDISNGSPIILYRQDLSRLGWALGEKARQTLVAKETP
jgi:DNA uptake protein ComE-like DNA-binding protein